MSTQRHEITAWLGDAAADLTDDQIDRLATEADAIAERYPDDVDEREERELALSAALQYILGEVTVQAAGEARARAQRAARDAYVVSRQVARMAALDGAPKATAARDASIDRMVLLGDLGERPRP